MIKRKLIRLDRGMKIPFGKYKGFVIDSLAEHDLSYLKWLWYENISPMTDSLDSFIENKIEQNFRITAQKEFDDIIRQEMNIVQSWL